MKSKNTALIITGPTASGKTQLSEMLAGDISCEIINADVGQFYKPLSVGTAKPNLNQIKYTHHLFDLIDAPEDLSVVKYRQLISDTVENICNSGKTPIIVGGSLFYIKSLFFPPAQLEAMCQDVVQLETPADPSIHALRAHSGRAAGEGWELLQKIDPERAAKIHPNDGYRVNRALEIWRKTGQKPSMYKPCFEPIFNAMIVFVCPTQEILNQRIYQRTEQMIKEGGWIEEARGLLGTEWEDFVRAKGLIGYPEIFDWISCKQLRSCGDKNNLNELINVIHLKTTQYAKRQKTFWRSFKNELNQAVLHNSNVKILEVELSENFSQVLNEWNAFIKKCV